MGVLGVLGVLAEGHILRKFSPPDEQVDQQCRTDDYCCTIADHICDVVNVEHGARVTHKGQIGYDADERSEQLVEIWGGSLPKVVSSFDVVVG